MLFYGYGVHIPYEIENLEITVNTPQGDEPGMPYLRKRVQTTGRPTLIFFIL